MGEFKQIIGRGTRVREDYGKTWFTIMDFRDATRHFEDKDFDGPPEQVYEVKAGQSIVPPEQRTVVDRDGSHSRGGGEKRDKYFIPDEEVLTVAETVVRYNAAGKRVDIPVDDHTRGLLQASCKTRREFHDLWRNAEQRGELLAKLEREGITAGGLASKYGNGFATYDLLAHVGYDMAPVTRKDRAQKPSIVALLVMQSPIRKQVLEGLLAKFVDEGREDLSDATQLKLKPFDNLGTVIEILREFGGRAGFEKVVSTLEIYLYDDA
jgi:type I restriction enzyme R subunit